MPREYFNPQEILKSLSYRKEIEEFSASLEKGDLSISQTIDYGFILYGQTKSGKTATSHILSGNSLKGFKTNGKIMVQTLNDQNNKASIGNTIKSETLVPNMIHVKINGREEEYNVIDTPGYGHTNGVLTAISNGYYHQRLFLKVRRIKFLLCFDFIHLQNTAEIFVNTIIQWTKSFNDYPTNRNEIWKSVAFIITKYDESYYTKEDLIAKLQNIIEEMATPYDPKIQIAVKQLIEFVIKEERIFSIKKIKEDEAYVDTELLQQIDSKVTNWWTREYDEVSKKVNMKPISLPICEQIIKKTLDKKYYNQFKQLIRYYNTRIRQFVQEFNENYRGQRFSLSFVFYELINDAMGHPNSHKFLDVMTGYVDFYYKNYDETYKEQRQKLERQLFELENNDFQAGKNQEECMGQDKNYLVKKFQCLQRIEELKQQIISIYPYDYYHLTNLQKTEHHLYKIIRELNKICLNRNQALEVVYKFGYLIHRIVQETKVFFFLVDIYGGQNQQKVLELVNNDWINLYVPLKDSMGYCFKWNGKYITYKEIHFSFINKFNIDDQKYKSLVINDAFVDFIFQFDIIDEDDIHKLADVLLKYTDNVLKETKSLQKFTLTKQIGQLICRLANVRIGCETTYDLKKYSHQKNDLIVIIRRVTKQLGKILELLGKFELARKVYDTIRFVDTVCKLFRAQINSLKNFKNTGNEEEQSTKQLILLEMKFSEYLAAHSRPNQAIQVLQQNFELVSSVYDLRKVSKELTDLMLQMDESSFFTQYLDKIFNEEYFDRFDEDLINEIMSYAKNSIL